MQAQNEGDSGQSEPLYACSMCGSHYPKSELPKHGKQEHNAPPDTTAEDIGQMV
jgi:rubredoxin